MKKQTKQYSAEEKAKIVIEVMTGELTMAQINSKYGIQFNQKLIRANWPINSWERLAQKKI